MTHTRKDNSSRGSYDGVDLASVPVAKCNSNWWMHRCYVSLLYRAATRKRYRPLGHVTIPLQPDLPRASCSASPSNGTTRTPTRRTLHPSFLPSFLSPFPSSEFRPPSPTLSWMHLVDNFKKGRKEGGGKMRDARSILDASLFENFFLKKERTVPSSL